MCKKRGQHLGREIDSNYEEKVDELLHNEKGRKMYGAQVIQMGTSWHSLSQMLLQVGRYSNPSLKDGDQGTKII